MSRWITPDDGAAWRTLFESFSASAFRLEGLQTYDAPGEAEAVARFLAGEDPQADTSWWTSMVQGHRAAGHTMSRVRIVTEPLTDYTRFELAVYPQLVEAGDDIRVIHAGAAQWPAGVVEHDYWLFDRRDLWLMHYTDSGAFVGAERVVDPAVIGEHVRSADIALAQSIPLHTFLAARRQAS
jgi:hypothetical protein